MSANQLRATTRHPSSMRTHGSAARCGKCGPLISRRTSRCGRSLSSLTTSRACHSTCSTRPMKTWLRWMNSRDISHLPSIRERDLVDVYLAGRLLREDEGEADDVRQVYLRLPGADDGVRLQRDAD